MNSAAGQILEYLRDQLRGLDGLAAVTIGADASSSQYPRAELVLTHLDERPADDRPAGRWFSLRAEMRVLARGQSPQEGLDRCLELAGAAQELLLADPFCGGLCQDLPTGRAMSFGAIRPLGEYRPPISAVGVEVRCNFEQGATP